MGVTAPCFLLLISIVRRNFVVILSNSCPAYASIDLGDHLNR